MLILCQPCVLRNVQGVVFVPVAHCKTKICYYCCPVVPAMMMMMMMMIMMMMMMMMMMINDDDYDDDDDDVKKKEKNIFIFSRQFSIRLESDKNGQKCIR